MYFNTIMYGNKSEKSILTFNLIDKDNKGYFDKDDFA